jgi:hypothetical protein
MVANNRTGAREIPRSWIPSWADPDKDVSRPVSINRMTLEKSNATTTKARQEVLFICSLRVVPLVEETSKRARKLQKTRSFGQRTSWRLLSEKKKQPLRSCRETNLTNALSLNEEFPLKKAFTY